MNEHGVLEVVTPSRYAIIRVDGRSFSSMTKEKNGWVKPFDPLFTKAMKKAALALCDKSNLGVQWAFQQSDEISVLLDLGPVETDRLFQGRVSKLTSLAASAATLEFGRTAGSEYFPVFDARLLAVPDGRLHETFIANYLEDRKHNGVANAVSMFARSHFSHKELMHKDLLTVAEMLAEKGFDVRDNVPEEVYLGTMTYKVCEPAISTWFDQRANEAKYAATRRGKWVQHAAGDLTPLVKHLESEK